MLFKHLSIHQVGTVADTGLIQLVKTPHSDPKEWTACIDLKEWTVYFRTHQWLIVVLVSFSAFHVALQLFILWNAVIQNHANQLFYFPMSSWDKFISNVLQSVTQTLFAREPHSGQPPWFANPSTAELRIHIDFTDNWFYTPSHPAVKYIRL